ncbi:hypothetical protein V7152_17440 [Neobacillus drentensis]|uniref:hypothetical protein n=1 Tax=Neobacillus drentensis TaxID=220684 RepID=UPI002FFFF6B2
MELIITILKSVSFVVFILFLILGLSEIIKVYRYFNQEMKVRKVTKAEYNQKTIKLNIYYIAFGIFAIIYGILKHL